MEKLYTCEEVAERYSVKKSTVFRWIQTGKLKSITVGGKLHRVREGDLEAFENGSTEKAADA